MLIICVCTIVLVIILYVAMRVVLPCTNDHIQRFLIPVC